MSGWVEVVPLRRAAAEADAQPACGDDPRRREMDEGGRPRTGCRSVWTRLSVPVDREGLQAQSDVQREEITDEAAGARRWQRMSPRGAFDFASGVQNDVVKLPAGAVQREANPTE